MVKSMFESTDTVTISGLQQRTDLNGLTAAVASFDSETGRFSVNVSKTGECVRIKGENLTRVNGSKAAAAEPENTWWSDLSEDMAYDWLIDCYRMRVDDDMAQGSFMHGLYAGDGGGAIFDDFLLFVKLAAARGVAPSAGEAWDWAKLCERAISLLPNAFERSDAAGKYGAVSAQGAGYALSLMAEQVYGSSCTDGEEAEDPLSAMVRDQIDEAQMREQEGADEGGSFAQLFDGIGGPEPWQALRTALCK
mmetsp:Transcript_20548/g.60683  ORF Transcript_20548/g.60683 Transcript_20548/m.60683 type:complete len:250 (+) Transcript_20548:70-819(+)